MGWRGRPLVGHAVAAALDSGVERVYVVVGHDGEAVAAALAGLPVVIVHNPEHERGMASSLRAGLRALPAGIDGVLVCLGDMPQVRAEHLDRLIAAFAPGEGRVICVPTCRGRRGNPVLLGAEFFAELEGLTGDQGGRRLLGAHAERVAEVAVDDPGVLCDVDTPRALAGLRNASP
jgi:molybdenum cofactor cytidylyltransferase